MSPPNKSFSKRSNNLTTQTLLDFDLEESSSDSDFRIEDHDDDSDDYSKGSKDDDDGGNKDGSESDDDENEEDDGSSSCTGKSDKAVVNAFENRPPVKKIDLKLLGTPICCACLGERSDDTNEIVECDGCGVTVHEGCYGVSESASVSSTVSSCSTEPWFCEACKAGVRDPVCELCPNKGGIFKETDVGKWVHLVCALYIPGVAFGEVDQLSSVTLFEMQYSKWGSKTCSLCEDLSFTRTGVCIGCDAGMCKNYFHVTCAQANGLLSEAHSEEADHADPFYAHCKLHSDKTLIKRRKRNFSALKLKAEQRRLEIEERKHETPSAEHLRIERKLKKHKTKFLANKVIKNEPWVPTQKMPRLLTTSASARRRLMYKAQLMGIDTAALEVQESQITALVEIRKKWHIPPAFSVEYIAYYLDRIVRLNEIKSGLKTQIDSNSKLLAEQKILREQYDQKIVVKQDLSKANENLKTQIQKFHSTMQILCPNKILPPIETIGKAAPNIKPAPPTKPMTVPTAAALKMGVGFPLPGVINNSGRVLSTTQRTPHDALLHDCGICKKCTDQHLLAKCDTCHFYYHLGCLNPPLTRHPKKSKLYGWQCSECDKSDDSEPDITLPKAQRRSRVRYSKDGFFLEKTDESIKDDMSSPPESNRASLSSTTAPVQPVEEIVEVDLSQFETDMVKTPAGTGRKRPKKSKSLATKKLIVELKDDSLMAIQSEKPDEIDPLSIPEIVEPEQSSESKFDVLDPLDDSKKKEKKFKKIKKAETTAAASTPTTEETIATVSYENLPQFTSEIITDSVNVTEHQNHDYGDSHHKQNRKRKKEKHKNKYSPESEKSSNKEHKRKHKRKDLEYSKSVTEETAEGDSHPRIKIKFKAIHLPGESSSSGSKNLIYVTQNDEEKVVEKLPSLVKGPAPIVPLPSPTPVIVAAKIAPRKTKKSLDFEIMRSPKTIALPARRKSVHARCFSSLTADKKEVVTANCDVCTTPGTVQNLVSCDECRKSYHFACLDPPLKKTPKRRGYSWHCADCDPSDREIN